MIEFIMKFISNEGFFEKITFLKKSSQNGKKMPFFGIFLGIFGDLFWSYSNRTKIRDGHLAKAWLV